MSYEKKKLLFLHIFILGLCLLRIGRNLSRVANSHTQKRVSPNCPFFERSSSVFVISRFLGSAKATGDFIHRFVKLRNG